MRVAARGRELARTVRDPKVAVPAVLLAFIVLVCFFGPAVAGLPSPNGGSLVDELRPLGTPGHLLGTNQLGNDMLSRLLHGGQVSLVVGFGATALGFSIGVTLGVVAGFYGGIAETFVMRFFDVLFAFPGLILALAIAAYLGPGVTHTIWAISVFGIAGFGRLARAQTVRVRNLDYVTTAKAAGAPRRTVIFGHILPNILPPLLTFALFGVGLAMIAEAALSYLGLGIRIPQASWGNMIASAEDYMGIDPALLVEPAVALFLTVVSINLLADGLRDRLARNR